MTFLLFILAVVTFAGALVAHYQCASTRHRRALSALLAIDAVAILLIVTAIGANDRFEAWMQEDGWAEWATFLAFATAAALFSLEAYRHSQRYWIDAVARAALVVGFGGSALFCLVVAGEEISWGQRLLALQPPEVFLHSNYQQELNMHNMLKGKSLAGVSLESKYLVALIAVAYGLVYPAVVYRLRGGERREALRKIAAPLVLAPVFAAVALAELTYPVSYTGEAAELFLGLAFLAAALLHRPAPAVRSRQYAVGPAMALAAIIAGGVLLQPLIPALVYGADEDTVAQTRTELDQLAATLATARTPRLERKRSVHKRVYTALGNRYFELADAGPLDGIAPAMRAEYYLDPWNNPYWIRWSRSANALVVYSFGPNRRRDSDIKALARGDLSQPTGDDIAVVVDLNAARSAPKQARAALPTASD